MYTYSNVHNACDFGLGGDVLLYSSRKTALRTGLLSLLLKINKILHPRMDQTSCEVCSNAKLPHTGDKARHLNQRHNFI